MGRSISFFYKLFLFIVVFHNINCISDLRGCADEKCEEIVCYAKTLVTYNRDNEYTLSFERDKKVIVYSKSAGSDTSLWGVSINGVRGYVPKRFLRETRKVNKIRFEVPTEYYEVINGELVPKRTKSKSERNVPKVDTLDVNCENCSFDSIVEGSEETINRIKIDNTEKLELPQVVNKPAIFSGVSGEILDSKIKASPSFVVVDGTTLPPYFDDDDLKGSLDEMDEQEDEEVESGDENDEEEKEASGANTQSDPQDINTITEPIQTDNKDKSKKNPPDNTKNNVVVNNKEKKQSPNFVEAIEPIPSEPKSYTLPTIDPLKHQETQHSQPPATTHKTVTEHQETQPPVTTSKTVTEHQETQPPVTTSKTVTEHQETQPPVTTSKTVSEHQETQPPVTTSKTVSEHQETQPPVTTPKTVTEHQETQPPVTTPKTATDSSTDNTLSNDVKGKSSSTDIKESSQNQDPSNINEKNSGDLPVDHVQTTTPSAPQNNEPSQLNSSIDGVAKRISEKPDMIDDVIKTETNPIPILPVRDPVISTYQKNTFNPTNDNVIDSPTKEDIINSTIDEEVMDVNNYETLNQTIEEKSASEINEKINVTFDADKNIVEVENTTTEIENVIENTTTLNPEPDTNIKEEINTLPSHLPPNAVGDIPVTESDNIEVDFSSNNQDITNLYASTESPQMYITPGNYGFDEPQLQDMLTESPVTQLHTSSSTPSIASEQPNTESPPIYQNSESSEDFNNSDENTYDFYTDSNLIDNQDKSSEEIIDESTNVKEQELEQEPVEDSQVFESTESQESFLTNIFNSMSSIPNQLFGMFKSDAKNEAESRWEEERLSEDVDRVVGGWNSFIASFLPAYSALPQCRPEENVIAMTEVSTDLVMWLIISAVSVLAFTLGYYFLENRKQDGKLLAMVNLLQKELLCSTKECMLLKDELTITKEKLEGIEDSSFGTDEMVTYLKKEIADSQHTVSDLIEKLNQTEEELANSTEAALELQTILDEQLSSKDTSNSSLTFTVTNLQSQLDEQQAMMNTTKTQLAAKVEENEVLLGKIMEVGKKEASIEKELMDMHSQLRQAREECESKSQQLHELSATMETSLQELKAQKSAEIKDLQSQLKNSKGELESSKVLLKARAHEVTSLQENLKLLKIDSNSIDTLIDVSRTKADLTQVTTEKNILTQKLEKEQNLLHELTNKMEVQDNQLKEMRDQLNEAEQKSFQATSRLEVLTNYFNQKEAELIKELNTKEGLWLSQQGENMSTGEKIQSLQKEIQQYKETTESFRRELAEQEAAWRARNAALEKRVNEQWLARRAAERQAEAAASEAQLLRQRLAAPSPINQPPGMVSPLNSMDSVGELPLLPPPHLPFPHFAPLGGLPPPPFLPPPLPLHRPPPLGRLSSPLPRSHQHMRHDRYSPDSRDRDYSPGRRSPYERRPYNSRRYDDDSYNESGDERRSRGRYDETETDYPPPKIRRKPNSNRSKGASSSSSESP